MAATSPSPSGVKLHYDTMMHIISVSEYAKDTVQLIATCRVLYHEGPKILLKKPIVILTQEQLTLQMELQVLASSLEPDVIQELVEILPLLTHIEYLRLVNADQLLRLHPNLTPAFCALTTLRHIDFSGLWDYLDDNDDWEQYHPAMLLENFALTLEELNMRKLSINLPLWINTFIHTFPNLTDLHIDTKDYDGSLPVGEFSLEVMHESHATNILQQCGVNSCGTWVHLEHFCGCVVDLYTIGLTSHISQVTLTDTLDDGPKTEMLAMMLHYAQPLHLKLKGIAGSMVGNADRGFISMLRDESVSNLISLNVNIDFTKDDREKDLNAVIDNLVPTMTNLPLEFLELTFVTGRLNLTLPKPTAHDHVISQRNGLPQPRAPLPSSAPLSLAELSLQSLNMDALIAHLESMPSLEAAHVVLPSSPYEGDYQWEGHDRMITRDRTCLAAAGHEQDSRKERVCVTMSAFLDSPGPYP
ncbi:hypothetical protein V8D89_005584 [Ganoderma adspersum]